MTASVAPPDPLGTSERRARRLAATTLRAAFAAAVVGWLVLVGVDHASQLHQVHLHIRAMWLVAAAPFTLAGGLFLPLAWRALVAAYGRDLTPGASVRVWSLASASRYLPTGLFAFGSRVVLASRHGIGKLLTLWTSVVEFGLLVVWSAVLGAALLPSHTLPAPWRIAGVILGIAVLGLTPIVLRRLPTRGAQRPRPRPSYSAIGLYGLNSGVRTIGSLFVASALLHVGHGHLALVAGAVNGAAAAGLVSIAPAGLGVREGVTMALLQPAFGLGNALALAVAFRVWNFAADLVWLAISLVVGRAQAPKTEASSAGAATSS